MAYEQSEARHLKEKKITAVEQKKLEFAKLYQSVSLSSDISAIRIKLDIMNRMISDSYSFMAQDDIAQCEQYIYKMRCLLEEKREQAEKITVLERQIHEKESVLLEKKRYIAAQRKILSASMRYDVLSRDNFRCVLCGASAQDGVKLHVDHIRPLAKGGKTEMSNLRTLCDRCNLGKGTKIERQL